MSENGQLRLAVVIGSTRNGRFGPTPASWFAEQARQWGEFEVDVIDLLEARLPDVLSGDDETQDPEPVRALSPRLATADAFVIVTPVYNHGYPASVKNGIDWFYDEWKAKPVGFVSYGGMGGGLHSVEQLRQVFSELHTVTLRDTISFANFWEQFDSEGRPIDGENASAAAKTLLSQLAWWAHALRDARRKHPYSG
jgi:NAD(P)H-dependent FMN reductase